MGSRERCKSSCKCLMPVTYSHCGYYKLVKKLGQAQSLSGLWIVGPCVRAHVTRHVMKGHKKVRQVEPKLLCQLVAPMVTSAWCSYFFLTMLFHEVKTSPARVHYTKTSWRRPENFFQPGLFVCKHYPSNFWNNSEVFISFSFWKEMIGVMCQKSKVNFWGV